MADKQRIVVLIDWYLPGTKAGGPVRSLYSLLKVLNRFFDFYVITKNTDLGNTEPYQNIPPNTLILNDEVYYYYFDNQRLTADGLLSVINTINPDLIYCNSFWSYFFSILPVRLCHKGRLRAPLLLAPRGMLSKGALGLKAQKKRAYLLVGKLFGWYRNISFHATQDQEKNDIRKYFEKNPVYVAPNINSSGIVQNNSQKVEGDLKLFYLSRIAKVKNLHFALECLREVSENYNIQYDIYGNLEEEDYWKECLAIIKTLPPNVKVSYKKELSFHEVQEVISRYNCLFLPTLNENYGHSIVESLLSGCPVIISDQTPWIDVGEFNAGFAIPLTQKQKFIEAIEAMAALSQQSFKASSENAITYIQTKINLDRIADQYKKLFNDCIKNGSVHV